MKCINCRKDMPEIKDIIRKANKQVLAKVCLNCKPQAPRRSERQAKPRKK